MTTVFYLPEDTDRTCDTCGAQAVEEIEHSLWSWYCEEHALFVGRAHHEDVNIITL